MTTAEPNAFLWDVDNRRGYANAMGRYKTEMELAFLRKHLKGKRLRILDIGGGSGRFAVPLAEDGHRVTVVDLSEAAIDILQRRKNPNIDALCRDFLEFEAVGRFDAVLAIESVQHFADRAGLFAKVRALLAPQAPFVFTALNSQSWRYQLHKLRASRPAYNVTNPRGYVASLGEAGLALSEMVGFVWMPLPVASNSPIVPAIAALERGLHLGKWLGQSPWLLVAATPQK